MENNMSLCDLMECAGDVFIPRNAVKAVFQHEKTDGVWLAAVEFEPGTSELRGVERSAVLPEWVKTKLDVRLWWGSYQ